MKASNLRVGAKYNYQMNSEIVIEVTYVGSYEGQAATMYDFTYVSDGIVKDTVLFENAVNSRLSEGTNSAEMKAIDTNKVSFIKSLKDGYSLYHTYDRPEDVCEVVRMNYNLSSKDMPKLIKVEGVEYMLFLTNQIGIVIDFVCKLNNGRFELYEMSIKAYNEYEKYMRELITA